MVKTSPSRAGAVGRIPGQRAEIPHTLRLKTETLNRSNIGTNSGKDFKNCPHQEKKKKERKKQWKGDGPSTRGEVQERDDLETRKGNLLNV